MRVFNCDLCGHLVFFDSVKCLHCGSALAFVPELMVIIALELDLQHGVDQVWHRVGEGESEEGTAPHQRYRMCRNRDAYHACNLAVPLEDPCVWCASCRQTRVLPDLSDAGNMRRWKQLEAGKRQLFYTLDRLGLIKPPVHCGPAFEFLADIAGNPPVMTGHLSGTITLNIAEADDDERARRRIALGEPYRTLLGHFRHESGHFYWDLLVWQAGQVDAFRAVFGDERQNYSDSLNSHYAKNGDYGDWSAHHVSTYATSHPWEDWAETWAHYLHMIDLLETAASYRVGITVPDLHMDLRHDVQDPFSVPRPAFHDMVSQWVPLTLMLNSLNRSLGQDDAYPFALSSGAMVKLRFVHDLLQAYFQPAQS